MAEAVRVDSAPRLDGTLGDRLWELAKPITDFRQREPRRGAGHGENGGSYPLHPARRLFWYSLLRLGTGSNRGDGTAARCESRPGRSFGDSDQLQP
jgi:hypothetical protein